VPVPTKADLKRFCGIDGWSETTEATRRGGATKKRGDHFRYRKILDDGTILRTRVSHGRGPAFDDPGMWSHVWRDQLGLESEDQFWQALRTRQPVPRGHSEPTPPDAPAKELWLVEFLVHVTGIPEADVLAMDEDEAMKRYLAHVAGRAP
jgi:hypothetical protein